MPGFGAKAAPEVQKGTYRFHHKSEESHERGNLHFGSDNADARSDSGNNARKVINNFLFGKPEDSISARAQVCVPQVSVSFAFFLFPTGAMAYFNDQFQLPAIEIDNMVPDRVLPSEPHVVRSLGKVCP